MGHKYDYEIDLGDGSAPDRVVRMVGSDKRVLDIGAGPGSISRVLSRKFRCRVSAVETDKAVIPRLECACDRVFRVDLNETGWVEALMDEGPFEVVVAADVLEHLYDPWAALNQIRGLVARNGYIVISLPHAGYSGLLASLIDDDFEYRESGLLDRTHIRFFGIKNIQELINNAGLAIVDAEFVIETPENTEFAGVWGRTPPQLRTVLSENRFSLVYQVVLKAAVNGAEVDPISLLELEPNSSTVGYTNHASVTLSPRVTGKPVWETRESEEKQSRGKIRLIAFFLTQFHPIPENDRWWGKGFTEWTNVTKAGPLFEGHYQPRLPTDLGFYDLRLREVRHEQIELAKQYGIDGFCYHYYWFSGKRFLNGPLDDMVSDRESDMPFCLCWANENWTRRWDGIDHEVLLRQQYLPRDDLNFIKGLEPLFNDPRYIRLDGAPFLIVYEPQRLPDPLNTVEVWREYCQTSGIGAIHLCAALTNDNEDYGRFGFDSGVQFPPHNHRCATINDQLDFYTPFHGSIVEYSRLAQSYLDREYSNRNIFRSVSPSWDQTARVGSRAFLTLNATPGNYEYWLSESIRRTTRDFPDQHRFVFINAWNEWAEGCHLEPDRKFGRQFLEATLRAGAGECRKRGFEDVGRPGVAGPLTGWKARMAELQRDLEMAKDQVECLAEALLVERQRLSTVYEDLSIQRKRLRTREGGASTEHGQGARRLPTKNGSHSSRLARSLREAVAFFRDQK